MRTIIAGSREIRDYLLIVQAVENSGFVPTVIISGGARGVDRLGERYGAMHDIPTRVFLPDWETIGKSAGFVRNRQMALEADCLIAVWDGKSKGTAHMIKTAKEYNLDVYIEEVS